MNTLTEQLNIVKVLKEAINIIEVASNGLTVTVEDIQTICNKTRETHLLFLNINEYDLAETLAIGAVTEANRPGDQVPSIIAYFDTIINDINNS